MSLSTATRRGRGRGRGRGERFASARSRIAYAASADVHGERIAFHEAELGVDVDGEGIDPGVVGVSLVIDAKRVDWLTAALFLQRGLHVALGLAPSPAVGPQIEHVVHVDVGE